MIDLLTLISRRRLLGFASIVVTLLGLLLLWPAAGQAPVSYTHLRAHETVLDLVCRLLLDKKNKN